MGYCWISFEVLVGALVQHTWKAKAVSLIWSHSPATLQGEKAMQTYLAFSNWSLLRETFCLFLCMEILPPEMSYKNNALYIHLLHSDSCTARWHEEVNSEPIYSVVLCKEGPKAWASVAAHSGRLRVPLHHLSCAKCTQDMPTVTGTNTQAPCLALVRSAGLESLSHKPCHWNKAILHHSLQGRQQEYLPTNTYLVKWKT